MVRSPSGSSHGGAAGSGGGGGGGLLGLVGLGGVYAHNGAGGAPPEAASNSVAVLPSRSSSQVSHECISKVDTIPSSA